MFARILVALKFTAAGRHALETAARLARSLDSRLIIFCALDYRLLHPDTPDETIRALTERAERRFETELKPLLQGYGKFAFNCWEADPAVEICRLAHDARADLVVLGCHEKSTHGAITRLGQVGSFILENAPCPVLLVPCPDRE